jgi:malonate decarboxylase beta subunit
MSSYQEATARQRIAGMLDAGSFTEFLPPQMRVVSPHLHQLDAPVSFDDGVAVGSGTIDGRRVFIAAQEGGFMGGAVGEVHGAKLVGMLRRAVDENADAVLETRAAGIPVIALVGGSNGCFGGMGIVARCTNGVVISEESRLAMSGPEVIETAGGVEEFDARDRALVWRVTGGKHRYLLGDAQAIVADDIPSFRHAALQLADAARGAGTELTLAALEAEQRMLGSRLERFGGLDDPLEIWEALGIAEPHSVPLLEIAAFRELADGHREGAPA